MRIYLILSALLTLLSCSEARLGGGPLVGSLGGDETKAKSAADPDKPSEETEGVPGYLVDPELVKIAAKDGEAVIRGEKGAVTSDNSFSSAGSAVVSVFVTTSKALADAQDSNDGKIEADFEGNTTADKDGSFLVKVKLEVGQLVIISAADRKETKISLPEASPLTSAVVAVFDGSSGVFMSLKKTDEVESGEDDDKDENDLETEQTNDPDGDDPGDEDETTEPDTPSCGGASVGGACWYLSSDPLKSCQTVCASRGGYNTATATYAGSGGTLAQCYEVLAALGVNGTELGDIPGVAAGCAAAPGDARVRWTTDGATTADAIVGGYRRACACNE